MCIRDRQNFTENHNVKFENIFDDIFAPLSFYRECIVALSKEYVSIEDYSIFDVLVDSYKQAGNYNVTWNAQNHSSGIYFVVLQSEDKVKTHKLMLMK